MRTFARILAIICFVHLDLTIAEMRCGHPPEGLAKEAITYCGCESKRLENESGGVGLCQSVKAVGPDASECTLRPDLNSSIGSKNLNAGFCEENCFILNYSGSISNLYESMPCVSQTRLRGGAESLGDGSDTEEETATE